LRKIEAEAGKEVVMERQKVIDGDVEHVEEGFMLDKHSFPLESISRVSLCISLSMVN